MRGTLVPAFLLVLVLTGCGHDHTQPIAAPGSTDATATAVDPAGTPVVESPTSNPPTDATTGPTGAGAKPKGSEPKVVQGGGAGSGDRGLDKYVAKVRDQLPGSTVDLRDEEVEAVAQQGCASLAAGKTTAALIAETARLAGVSRAEAVDLITFAVDDVCPDQLDRAGEFS